MAQELDPERRRKLLELGRWHEEWRARYGIDDAEFVPEGADSGSRRSPTPEQERELMRRSDEIMGYEPDTGRYLADAGNPPLARSDREAQLYMDLRPCWCGETGFDRSGSAVTLPDGTAAIRYAAACGNCGRPREFVFRSPPQPPPADGELRYGGAEPSQLLDAGEWLLVADQLAGAVPTDPHRRSGAERSQARDRLAAAAAAVDEALKFVPADQAAVPPTGLWSERGDSLYEDDPDRFQVARLIATRDSYRELLGRIGPD